MWRIGEGYDVHRLSRRGPLMLGCIAVSEDFGAVGHSDGDVIAHALCDAILGALGLGDIGQHFPSTDPQWAGASSRRFLEFAVERMAEQGYTIGNVDCTVVLERPKLRPKIDDIRESLAEVLDCSVDRISVKAKTAEGLGPVGDGLALEARVVVLLANG